MRKNYNILWLDDDFPKNDSSLEKRVKIISEYLIDDGFIPNIIKVSNENEVNNFFRTNKKVDLFISDYNIGSAGSYTGFDFLVSVRKKYKQEVILYSHTSEKEIRTYMVRCIEDESLNLSFFSKFIFLSAIRNDFLIDCIEEVIDLTLIRWGELNALRGMYLAETSTLEHEIKKYIVSNQSDTSLIGNIDSNTGLLSHTPDLARKNASIIVSLNKVKAEMLRGSLNEQNWELSLYICQLVLYDNSMPIFSYFDEIRKIRNGFGHIKESIDTNGQNTIALNDGTVINENDIIIYRKKLIDFLEAVYSKIIPSNIEISNSDVV